MRRIKKVSVKFLALVKRGANHMPVLYKSADQGNTGEAEFQTLTKELPDFEERGELLSVAYSPEYDGDSQGHIADHDVVREMAHSFMRNGAQLNIRHGDKVLSKEQAYVAENFIIQEGDPRFEDWKDLSGNDVDVVGGWATLIKIEDKKLRSLFKDGGWNGVSLQGPAILEDEDEEVPVHVQKALDFYHRHHKQGDDELKPEELAKVLEDNNKNVAKVIGDALKPLTKLAKSSPGDDDDQDDDDEEEEKPKKGKKKGLQKEAPPKFEGDRNNPDDIRAHAKKVKIYQLEKSVNWDDPKSIEKYTEALELLAKESEEDEEELPRDPKDREIYLLKRENARLEGRSDLGSGGDNRTRKKSKVPDSFGGFQLSKEEEEGFEIGQRIAKEINKRNAEATKR